MSDRPAPGRLVTFGESMGLFTASSAGRFGLDRGFTLGIGGAESNVAIGAARLGVPVTWFGRLGNDATGDLIERLLVAEGVDTVVIRDPGFTGLMVKHERFASASHVDYHRSGSAGSRLSLADIPVEKVRAASILHTTGITAALSTNARATLFEAVELAREAGTLVSVDVNYRRKLWSSREAAPVLRDLISHSDIVFAGPDEAGLVTGELSADAVGAAKNLSRYCRGEVIVKDGARGCAALVHGVSYEMTAIAVTAVDPVGAGDAFVAGYLADLLSSADVPTRLSTAVRCGGLAVSVPGDCENLPFRAELASVDGDDVSR